MQPMECVACGGAVQVPPDAVLNEILVCPDCGAELEVVALDPLTLAEAPEVEEDWGE